MNFVFARETQEAFKKMTRWQKFKARWLGRKIYLRHEQREGWSGKLPFYLFYCAGCKRIAKDYPHGHIERRYLNCSFCGAHHDFVPWWVEWVMLWSTIKLVWKYRA